MKQKNNVFMQILDVILPVLIYYLATSIVLYALNRLAENILINQGEEGISILLSNARAISAINNGIAMLFGALLVLRQFIRETSFRGDDMLIKTRKAIGPGFREGVRKLRERGNEAIIPVLLCMSAAIFLNLVIGFITDVIGSGNYENIKQTQYSVTPLIGVILYGIISPVAEEMIYRGVLLSKLSRYINPASGLIASSLIFGLFHGNLVQGVYAFFLGLLIGAAYIKHNAFFVPLLCHSMTNLLIYLLAYMGIPGTQMVPRIITCAVSGVAAICLFILFMRKGVNENKELKKDK